MTHIIPKLIKLAETVGIEVVKIQPNGHYHLKGGPFLVNYYPHSKSRTAYVAGTFKSVKNVTPEKAIRMCFTQPESQGDAHKRKKNTRKARATLHRKGINNCHWCDKPITIETSTMEHIIPLASNGLDNANNRTLACRPCNQLRGCNMPELKELK